MPAFPAENFRLWQLPLQIKKKKNAQIQILTVIFDEISVFVS